MLHFPREKMGGMMTGVANWAVNKETELLEAAQAVGLEVATNHEALQAMHDDIGLVPGWDTLSFPQSPGLCGVSDWISQCRIEKISRNAPSAKDVLFYPRWLGRIPELLPQVSAYLQEAFVGVKTVEEAMQDAAADFNQQLAELPAP